MHFGIKTLVGILFLTSLSAHAEVYYVPASCSPEKAKILVTNNSNETLPLWVQLHYTDIEEVLYEIPAKTQKSLRASAFLNTSVGFSIQTINKALTLAWQCGEAKPWPLTSLTSPVVEHFIPNEELQVEIRILNLAPLRNNVKIQFLSASDEILREEQSRIENSYDTQAKLLRAPLNTQRIRIEGEGRLHSWVTFADNKMTPGLVRKPASLAASEDKIYFLVSTRESHPQESFVVGISDPAMITQAREQIQNPQLEKILVAGIKMGHDNTNRNFSSADRAPYSWSVDRVDAFGDLALQDCDGSPEQIEMRLMDRIKNGGARICFWRYRVVKELTPAQVERGY